MKIIKGSMMTVISVLFMLVSSVFVYAIGFDAEEKYSSIFVITSSNSLGSGFAVGENCIITNAHVIEDANNIKITLYDGKTYKADIAAIDYSLDIAILKVDNVSFSYLAVADYKNTKIGTDVYTIGAPNSLAYTLTKGILSAKERQVGKYKYLQIDAPINSGNSGGPLLNENGEVIGVNTLKLENTEGVGLAIPMTAVSEFLKSNGFNITETGNVVGIVENSTVSNNDNGKPIKPVGKNFFATKWIIILIGLVILLVTIVIVFVMLKKNRNIKPKLDETDRTNFDIDIYG